MTITAIGCKRTIGGTSAIGSIVAVFAFITFFCAIHDAIATETVIRNSGTIGFAVVICAGTACIAAKGGIVIAFVTGFTGSDNAIAACPFTTGFAAAKPAIIAFLECTILAAFTFFAGFTDFALVAKIAGFVAIDNAVAAEGSLGTVGIAAAISAITTNGIP